MSIFLAKYLISQEKYCVTSHKSAPSALPKYEDILISSNFYIIWFYIILHNFYIIYILDYILDFNIQSTWNCIYAISFDLNTSWMEMFNFQNVFY